MKAVHICLWTFAVGIAVGRVPCSCAADDETVSKLKGAWLARQTRIHSGKFTCVREAVYTKGSLTGPAASAKGITNPREDLRVEDESSVIAFDGNKVRYECNKKTNWARPDQALSPITTISTFNGEDGRFFMPSNSRGRPEGGIKKAHNDAQLVTVYPAIMPFRTTTSAYWPFATGEIVERLKSVVDGKVCHVVSFTTKSPNMELLAYVDPEIDYSISRVTMLLKGSVRTNIDIHYKLDSVHGWIPSKWEIVQNVHEGTRMYNVKVKDYQLNCSFPKNYFDFEFPPGTVVEDDRCSPPRMYLVRNDGGERTISGNERLASYEEIVASDSGKAVGPQKKAFSYRTLVMGLGGVALLLYGLRIWIHRRRTHAA